MKTFLKGFAALALVATVAGIAVVVLQSVTEKEDDDGCISYDEDDEFYPDPDDDLAGEGKDLSEPESKDSLDGEE